MDYKITYNKDQKLEEIGNKVVEIFFEAVYSYIMRKGLLKHKETLNPSKKAGHKLANII